MDESERAVELKKRLKKRLKKKKTLIIFDDNWKEIHDLEEIGIPSCKDDDDVGKMGLSTIN